MSSIVSEDVEIIIGERRFGFKQEFINYLVSVGYGTIDEIWRIICCDMIDDPDTMWKARTCPIFIGHMRAFGLENVSSESTTMSIGKIPAFYVGKIISHCYCCGDGYEILEVSFPWKIFAKALYMQRKSEPLVGEYKLVLDAVENGTLKLPEED